MTKDEEIKEAERRVEYLHGYQEGLKTACFIAPFHHYAFEVEIGIKEQQLQEAVAHLRELLRAEGGIDHEPYV